MKIVSKFTRGIISKALKKVIHKKTGYDIDIGKLKEMKARKGFRVVENETTVEDENTETVDENDSEN